MTKPLNNETVESCLYLGLYQVLCTRIPAHAAISETVTATKQLGFHALSGIVNAILRRATRETDAFQSQLQQAHGLPSWLYKRLKETGQHNSMISANSLNTPAPLTLRINQRQIGRDAYLLKLQAQSIQARACAWSDVGIVIEQSVQITELPGYQQGWFSVQDEHAQLCASLLHDLDQKIALDACAAPGGKTAHLLEAFKPKQLIALDHDAKRLLRVSENISRLQLDASRLEILAADATTWQAPDALDCIVLTPLVRRLVYYVAIPTFAYSDNRPILHKPWRCSSRF